MQEIIPARYLMCFVFEGGLDTQYLEKNSFLWSTASQLIINQQFVSYSLWSEGLRHALTHLEGKKVQQMDWGREDHPGTKSTRRTRAKRQQRKIEWLEKEREEGREKNNKQFRYKSLIQRKTGKIEGKSKWQKRWNESKDKGTEMCEKTTGGLLKQN